MQTDQPNPTPVCTCKHPKIDHHPHMDNCLLCSCPEYHKEPTPEAQEWRKRVLHRAGVPQVDSMEREIDRMEARLREVTDERDEEHRLLMEQAAITGDQLARIEELEAALRNSAEEFHDYIRASVEAGKHMHMGADGDPRFSKCLHRNCQAARKALEGGKS